MRKYLPTWPSRSRCSLLVGAMILIYILIYFHVLSFIDGYITSYVIKPLLWLAAAAMVWCFPRIHPAGLRRLRVFLHLWAFNMAVICILIWVATGFFDGFGKSPYNHSLQGMLINLFCVGSVLVGREYVRSYLVNSLTKDENYTIFLLVTFIMTMMDITPGKLLSLEMGLPLLQFLAQSFLPALAVHWLVTYFSYLGGAGPAILFMGLWEGFEWFSPVLPNPRWLIQALVGIMGPVFCFMALQSIYLRVSGQLSRRQGREESIGGWIATSLISVAIIWFTVGVFPVYPTVIATGSMEPVIYPGDVVLVQKVAEQELQIGDVIQYQMGSIMVTHRITEIIREGAVPIYRTKGDNNSTADREPVKLEQIKGRVIQVVPKIGWPTLLFKSRKDVPLKQVVF